MLGEIPREAKEYLTELNIFFDNIETRINADEKSLLGYRQDQEELFTEINKIMMDQTLSKAKSTSHSYILAQWLFFCDTFTVLIWDRTLLVTNANLYDKIEDVEIENTNLRDDQEYLLNYIQST